MGPSAVDTIGPSSEALSPCALTDMVNVPAASTEPSNNPLAIALGNELCLECSLIVYLPVTISLRARGAGAWTLEAMIVAGSLSHSDVRRARRTRLVESSAYLQIVPIRIESIGPARPLARSSPDRVRSSLRL
jgi:hypothetical protein